MARGKKNGGRGDGRGAHGGRGGGRHSHAKPTRGRGSARGKPTASSAPSAAFLAALEAQRAKQAAEEAARQPPSATVEQAHAATVADAATAQAARPNVPQQQTHQRLKRPALPGFVFDEERGRYFKLTKHDEQLQKKKLRAEAIAQAQLAERKARFENRAGTATAGRVAARRCGWVGRLAQREIDNAPAFRDCSGLLSRYYRSRLSNRDLRSVDVALDAARDRFSAMEINADASRVFVGYASGRVQSFVVNESNECGRRELERDGSLIVPESTISALRFHPRQPGLVMVSAIGAGVSQELATLHARGGSSPLSGRVVLLHDAGVNQHSWRFPDPWTVEWSPVDPLFSVGLHGDVGAVIVNADYADTARQGITATAPSGKVKSDTLSQSFCPRSSSVVVNGSRDGSWWVWDTRVPRRASEFVADSKSKNVGAVQCVRVLSDERRMLLQRSNGELSVVDLRSLRHSIATRLSGGVKDVYRSMLRFDVDASETVVVAAMGSSVDAFDLHGGYELAHMRVFNEPAPQVNPIPEQVFLRDASCRQSVWALGRSAIYRSHPLDNQ